MWRLGAGRCSANGGGVRALASPLLGAAGRALRALWPAAPEGLGALCVTEKRSVRPADLQTRLEGLVLHRGQGFRHRWRQRLLVAGGDAEPGTRAAIATCR